MIEKIIAFNYQNEFLAEVTFSHQIFRQFILSQLGHGYFDYWFEEWRMHGATNFQFFNTLVVKQDKAESQLEHIELHDPLFYSFFKKWLLKMQLL